MEKATQRNLLLYEEGHHSQYLLNPIIGPTDDLIPDAFCTTARHACRSFVHAWHEMTAPECTQALHSGAVISCSTDRLVAMRAERI